MNGSFGFMRNARKIVCVGRNYAAHARELGNEVPTKPLLFLKPPSSFLAPGEGPIVIPEGCSNLHHEVELGLVIGKAGKNIPVERAAEFVEGYFVALDMTARELQDAAKAKGHPWSVAKGYDTFLPAGPFLSPETLQAHRIRPEALELWCGVDGDIRQRGNTGEMLWKIPQLLSYISGIFRLEPGDCVLTGTPEGVGPVEVGQRLRAGISGLPESEIEFTVAGHPIGSRRRSEEDGSIEEE